MSRLSVIAAGPEDFAWLVERTSCAVTEGFRAIKAVDRAGRVLGMVGYDLWTPNSVHCHMAVDSPIAWRTLLRPAFAYPFLEAEKSIILACINAGNARSVHLTRRFGFRETHRVRDGWAPGEDLLYFEMRREECRWLALEEKVRRQEHPPRRDRPCHDPLGSTGSRLPTVGRPLRRVFGASAEAARPDDARGA